MNIELLRFYDVHRKGGNATHPMPLRLDQCPSCVAPPGGQQPTALSPLQSAAQSQTEPVRAAHWHTGASAAAALTLDGHANHSTLGHVQLPFLGLMSEGGRTAISGHGHTDRARNFKPVVCPPQLKPSQLPSQQRPFGPTRQPDLPPSHPRCATCPAQTAPPGRS